MNDDSIQANLTVETIDRNGNDEADEQNLETKRTTADPSFDVCPGRENAKVDDLPHQSPELLPPKYHVGTKVTVRCDFNLNYILHVSVTRIDAKHCIYMVAFEDRDNADPHKYTEDEMQKIVSNHIVGMRGIKFVPYSGMPVFAYRGNNEEKAEIVHVFKNDAKLKRADDNSLSTFCVPYNQIRPRNDDDDEIAGECAKFHMPK